MAKRTEGRRSRQFKLVPPRAELERFVRDELRQRMRVSVLGVIEELFEEETRELCGEPWSRKADDLARRGGSERGSIYLEGQRVPVRYPRIAEGARTRSLQTYRALRSYDVLGEEVQRRLLRGISTRDYGEAVTAIAEGAKLRRSTVSAAFVHASAKSLDEMNGRDLSKHLFVAIFLDGLVVAGATLVIGLGVTTAGEKVLVGLREGHTENATVVAELLDSLIERGLVLPDRFLAVIDGSKALRKALLDRWKGRIEIQRCQAHKKRNVIDQLPPPHQDEARRRMSAAYALRDAGEARKLLENTIRWLQQISEPAAESLEEGLDETLTVVRLGLPDLLRRTLATTNPIESILGGVRYRTARVKRWRCGKGQMAARWTASALLLIETRLHKVKGYHLMPMLIDALKRESVDAKARAS